MSDYFVIGLNIPTGVPLEYELDEDLKPVTAKLGAEPISWMFGVNRVSSVRLPNCLNYSIFGRSATLE